MTHLRENVYVDFFLNACFYYRLFKKCTWSGIKVSSSLKKNRFLVVRQIIARPPFVSASLFSNIILFVKGWVRWWDWRERILQVVCRLPSYVFCKIPQSVTTPNQSQIPQSVTTPNQSQIPQSVATPTQSQIPQSVTTLTQSQIPQSVTTPTQSQIPQSVTTPNQSQIPQSVTTPTQSQIHIPFTIRLWMLCSQFLLIYFFTFVSHLICLIIPNVYRRFPMPYSSTFIFTQKSLVLYVKFYFLFMFSVY